MYATPAPKSLLGRRERMALAVSMVALFGACARMSTTVEVSCDPEIAHDYNDLSLQLIYQASKVDHPPSSEVALDSNPARVRLYNAPISLGINGGPQALRFVVPSPFQWGQAKTYRDRIGRGWVLVERGRLRFGYEGLSDTLP